MTGAACRTENAYPSAAPYFTFGFHRGSYCPVVCVSLFHCNCLVVWILSFDWSVCLIACYLNIFYLKKISALNYSL